MMRNFTYKIVVAIVVFISYAVGSNAQTPVPTVSINLLKQPKNDFKLVSTTDDGRATVYHAVSGTSVEFTLENYDSKFIYSYARNDETEIKNLDVESDGKFTLILTNDTQDNSVRYTYKFYASNDDDTSSQYSIDFVVYKEPQITQFSLNPASSYCLVGSSVEVTLNSDVTIPWGKGIINEWTLGDTGVTNVVSQNRYTFSSEESGSYNLNVKMTVPSPADGVNWVEKEVSTTITVYKVPTVTGITLARQYALSGDSAFDIEVQTTNDTGITPSVEWKIAEKESSDYINPDQNNPLKATFNPQDAGEYKLSAVVTFTAPDGKTRLTEISYPNADSQVQTITVYNKPSVSGITLARQYALSGDSAFDIEVQTTNDTGITPSVEWKIAEKESSDYINPDQNDPLKATFNPQDAGEYKLSAVVTFTAPDGKTKLTEISYPNADSQVQTITVYNKPSVSGITLARQYALSGDSAFDIEVQTTNDTGITPSVEWKIAEKESSNYINPDQNNPLKATFNPQDAGEYKLSAVVTFTAPDGKTKLTEISYPNADSQVQTITVYDEPTVNDCHIDSELDDNDKNSYATFVGCELDLTKLINLDPENNNGFQAEGWEVTWSWSINDVPQKGAKFEPTEPDSYTIVASISNNSNDPTGSTEPWYKKEVEFTFNVLEVPQWKNNINDVFDKEADKLHVQSGDNVTITVSLSSCAEGATWGASVKSGGENLDFNDNTSTSEKIYIFSKTNVDKQEKSYEHEFVFTYNVPLLFDDDNVKSKCSEVIKKTIVVWQEITANVDSNDLEMRVNDVGSQQIEFNVVGGDPNKWNISLESTDLPQGSWSTDKDNRMLEYSIANSEFSQNGNNEYKFKAVYKDGQTEVTKELSKNIIVYEEPTIGITLSLRNKDNVSYKEVNGQYSITCYESDEIQLTATPAGGKQTDDYTNWKYITGDQSHDFTTNSDISGNTEITFINYLNYSDSGSKKVVKTIKVNVVCLDDPDGTVDYILPDLGDEKSDEAKQYWEKAININNETERLDLYAGWEDLISFNPQDGFEDGWTYKWKLDDEVVSTTTEFDHTLDNPTDGYKNQVISFTYKNSIPASDYQEGENVGLEETKSYYVRVWRKAELPDEITLKDDYNVDPDHINVDKAIREGNKLILSAKKIQYGYNPEGKTDQYNYELKENGNVQKIEEESNKIKSEIDTVKIVETDNGLASSKNTYKFSFSNKGPRDIPWENDSITETITVYNRPKTPSSLIRKGNGNSGTLIITYDDGEGNVVPVPEDYSIVFRYIDANGKTISKEREAKKENEPNEANDKRWITTDLKLTDDMMKDAYAFSRFNYTKDNGWEQNVRITSGRIIAGDIDESWDESEYNLTDEQMAEARARTRAGGGDYTAIQSVESEEGVVSVYNSSGVKVATSTENLKPGIYIIRSMQNGEMNSKKLSVK